MTVTCITDKKNNFIKTTNHRISPNIYHYRTKLSVDFNENCLKQASVTFNHEKVVNIYIVYEVNKNINIRDYPKLENYLFGAVTLTKNADVDKNKYFGYGIGFDRYESFSSPGIGLGRNIITFGVDMGSSTKIDNRKKYILILGKGPTQGLEHTLNAEKNVFD